MKYYLFDCNDCEKMTKHEMHLIDGTGKDGYEEEYSSICTHCRTSRHLIKNNE